MTGRVSKAKGHRSAATPLVVIAAVFGASVLFRLAGESGVAIALEAGELAAPQEDTQGATPDADLDAALAAIRAREERLDGREAALEDRMRALQLAEEVVARNLEALEAAEQRLRGLIARADEAAESDLAQLTAVYENMKAKEAGPLFERMSPDFAAGFLGRMRPDAAAAIMAELPPEMAYSISVLLASRNAEAARAVSGQ